MKNLNKENGLLRVHCVDCGVEVGVTRKEIADIKKESNLRDVNFVCVGCASKPSKEESLGTKEHGVI